MHALRGWKLEIKNYSKSSYDMIVSNDYKLLSISAYYLNDSQNLFLDSSKTRDLLIMIFGIKKLIRAI